LRVLGQTCPIRKFRPTLLTLRCECCRIELEDPGTARDPYQCAQIEDYETSGWLIFLPINVGTVNNIAIGSGALVGLTIHKGSGNIVVSKRNECQVASKRKETLLA